jgi:Gas vesicle synthesis protein GvpL/GvpF
MGGAATYLYAIIRSMPANGLTGIRGIGGAPVRALADSELACIAGTVDLAEFGEDALRANLENLGWLERVARQHDDVVQDIARRTPTVPLRLAVICRDDASALDRLRTVREDAITMLNTIDGREEWGVKLLDMGEEPAPAVNTGSRPSGTAYLQRSRQRLDSRRQASALAAQDAETVFGALAEIAVQSCRHRPQDPKLSGVAHPMSLNAAFLVDRARAGEFRSAVVRLAADRAPGAVVLTGPWPAYSFVTLEA